MMDDNYADPWNNQDPDPSQTGGYDPRLGPVVNGYDPGPNWNNGVAPPPPDPRYDWNGGSPVNSPLDPGHGWEWQHPSGNNSITAPTWNIDNKQWDYGSWNQKKGGGIGYVVTPPPQPPPGPLTPPTTNGGAVPPVRGGSGINVPSASLPADILGIFNRVPEKTPIQNAYQDALLRYMQRGFETPSLDDSLLGPQTEVFRAANQRNTERQRRSAVERASAQGQNQSGYVDNLINEGVQKQGFNNAQFNANLLGGELTKRREELQAGLQLASATGDAEAQRELTARLAQVSAAMQQQGLNLQGQLGAGDLDLRWLLGTEGLNQNALQIIMQGMR